MARSIFFGVAMLSLLVALATALANERKGRPVSLHRFSTAPQELPHKKGLSGVKVGDRMRFHAARGALSQQAKKGSAAKKSAMAANNKKVEAEHEKKHADTICAKDKGSSSCKKARGRAKKTGKAAKKQGKAAAEKYRKQGAAAAKKGDHAKAANSYNNANTYASGKHNMQLSKKSKGSSKGGSKGGSSSKGGGGLGVSVGVGVHNGGHYGHNPGYGHGHGMHMMAGGGGYGMGMMNGGMGMMNGGMGMMNGGMGMMHGGNMMMGMNPPAQPYGPYPMSNVPPIWDDSEYGAWNDVKQKEFETQMMIGTTHTPYGQGNFGPGSVHPSGPRQPRVGVGTTTP